MQCRWRQAGRPPPATVTGKTNAGVEVGLIGSRTAPEITPPLPLPRVRFPTKPAQDNLSGQRIVRRRAVHQKCKPPRTEEADGLSISSPRHDGGPLGGPEVIAVRRLSGCPGECYNQKTHPCRLQVRSTYHFRCAGLRRSNPLELEHDRPNHGPSNLERSLCAVSALRTLPKL